MKIAGTDYDLNMKALWVFLSGCKAPHCKNCHNSALWDFNIGEDYKKDSFNLETKIGNPLVDRCFICGGEPLDNDLIELEDFIKTIKSYSNEVEIWLWTRYYKIPQNIKQHLDYAKVGEYQCDSESYEEPLFGITLASLNQKIIKINP